MSKLSDALEDLAAEQERCAELADTLDEIYTTGFVMHADAGHPGTFRWCENVVCRAINTPDGDSIYR